MALRRWIDARWPLVGALALAACSGGGEMDEDPGLAGLSLAAVKPGTVVPGSRLVVEGTSFVDQPWGTSRLVLAGSYGGAEVTAALPARFEDFGRMVVAVDDGFFAALGALEGDFTGTAHVEVDSPVDGLTHQSNSIDLTLEVRQQLTPQVAEVDSGLLIYVNDRILVTGGGFLLGGDEGETVASITGCFTALGDSTCVESGEVEVPLATADFDRTSGTFDFAPAIAGIRPGTFEGTVLLRNRPAGGPVTESAAAAVTYDLTEPALFSVSPDAASLGQYVDLEGGGFVGGEGGGVTLLELEGQFAPDGSDPFDVTLTLVPEWVEGRLVRYVLNEDDALGSSVDLRRVTGTFTGTITPVIQYEEDEVVGGATTFTLALAPVKQVVHLVFKPTYVESLRHFGLRAVDQEIRARILEVVRRDYWTINLEVRLEEPTDFALYSVVEVAGPDPNGLGLLGYDNSPGKDTGNIRLFDQIGGVNAVTQEDGSPGYGGVFIESLFAFSSHPGEYAQSIGGDESSAFDDVFDPFRPDRDGTPVSSADLGGGLTPLTSGDGCPAADRAGQVACAVFVLGSLIGTTLSHEIGHSLGLANPFGEGFHNSSDEPNRMMDNGGDRPFNERAELFGQGPGVFCVTEYDYLRQILPTDEPDDPQERPTCF
ncbi:MAG TPA: hypothetical protein VKZ63_09870 [Kofleriaceae bacterium]|nr:hypothetical protein [Kofleriaceae bacterium]